MITWIATIKGHLLKPITYVNVIIESNKGMLFTKKRNKGITMNDPTCN